MEVDPSTLTFDQWVSIFFEPRVTAVPKDRFKEIDIALDPEDPVQLVRNITETCTNLHSIIDTHRPSWPHVNSAIWSILGPGGCDGGENIWNPDVPIELKIECVESMFCVYANVVKNFPADVDMETCFYMWWDLVCDGFCKKHGHRSRTVFRSTDPEVRRLHYVIFRTLVRIYDLDEQRCQDAALHGMGHLQHYKVAEFVQRIIDNAKDWHPETIEWLRKCRDGTVM